MFYLETKDGDKFFTSKDSDDRLEFEKIIDSKLGKDAANMFDLLVEDEKVKVENILECASSELDECISDLDSALDNPNLDRQRLDDILYRLQKVYTMMS